MSARTNLNFILLTGDAFVPTKAYEGDMGYDLRAPHNFTINRNSQELIDLEIQLRLPWGYGAFIKDRSSVAVQGICVMGGVIDNGYEGNIKVILRNLNNVPVSFEKGNKIAQLVPIYIPAIAIELTHPPESNHGGLILSDCPPPHIRAARGIGSSGA